MSNYVYIETARGFYTVGFFTPNGRWITDSDHPNPKEAAQRVRYLNGGNINQKCICVDLINCNPDPVVNPDCPIHGANCNQDCNCNQENITKLIDCLRHSTDYLDIIEHNQLVDPRMLRDQVYENKSLLKLMKG